MQNEMLFDKCKKKPEDVRQDAFVLNYVPTYNFTSAHNASAVKRGKQLTVFEDEKRQGRAGGGGEKILLLRENNRNLIIIYEVNQSLDFVAWRAKSYFS